MTIALTRHLREWAVLTLCMLALLVFALQGNWFERLDNSFYDAAVARSDRPVPDDILILAIDDASLARVGRWPWSREVLATALDILAHAGSGPVLLDILLAEPQLQPPTADARLAAAIAAHGRVVLPVLHADAQAPAMRPLAPFAATARLGHAQALVDRDGVTRRILAWESDGASAYRHVGLLLRDIAGHVREPEGRAASMVRQVSFAGPAGHFARRPLADLLDGRLDAAQLRGKTVLIGATATGLGDTVVTPMAGVNGVMPGVEFVANVLDGARAGRLRAPMRLGWQVAVAVPLLLGYLAALLLLAPRRALLLTLLLLAAEPLAALGLHGATGWWWPPAAPLAALLLAYPLWNWRRLESSLDAMTREVRRMEALLPGGLHRSRSLRFLDPVEHRIAAITHAVDGVADALVADGDSQRSQQTRQDMLRHLAHDLRSPLVSLRALADQLRTGSLGTQEAMIGRIDACANRALELTEQFLLIGRAQALEGAPLREVDLVQLLHGCADDLWEDAQALGGRIERRCTADLALVRGDERLLRRALLNLGWNALRHGPQGGVVTLSLDQRADGVLLAVQDEGDGFALQDLAGPQQRRSVAGRPGMAQGHGLGMTLVQQVAASHGAVIEVDHPPQGGFRIGLRIVYSRPPSAPAHGT